MGAPLDRISFHASRTRFSGRELFRVALRLREFDHVPIAKMQEIFATFAPDAARLSGSQRWYWETGRDYHVSCLDYLTSWTGICCTFCGQVTTPPGPAQISPSSDHDSRMEWRRSQWVLWDRKGGARYRRTKLGDGHWIARFAIWASRRRLADTRWLELTPAGTGYVLPWCEDCHAALMSGVLKGEKDLFDRFPPNPSEAFELRETFWVDRVRRLIGSGAYQERARRFAGSAMRSREVSERPEEYEVAEFDLWDPDERAEWDRKYRLREMAETAATKAFNDALAASIMNEEAA